MESIRAIRSIKLHVHEAMRENGWRNRYAQVVSADYHEQIYKIGSRLVEVLAVRVGLLLTVYLAARAVIGNDMTVGTLVAFLAYRASFISSATSLVDHGENYRLLSIHLERLSDIVAHPRENVAAAAPRRGALPPPEIRAEKLSFAYSPNDPPILKDCDFHIPAGAFAAITGTVRRRQDDADAHHARAARSHLGQIADRRTAADAPPTPPHGARGWARCCRTTTC
jgi:ATP-binding cassette subfamily B protein RaxB